MNTEMSSVSLSVTKISSQAFHSQKEKLSNTTLLLALKLHPPVLK